MSPPSADGALRVLLVSDSYPPLIGGATRATQQLGRQLHRRGHAVTVATAWQRAAPASEDDAGVAVHRLRGLVSRVGALSADPVRYTPPPFPDPELAWRLRRLVQAARPDVVHSYGWITYSCAAALAATSVPLVLAARDYGNVCAVRTLIRQGHERGSVCAGPGWAKCHECSTAFYGQAKGAVAASSVLAQRAALRARADALHSTSAYTERMIERFLLRGKRVTRAVIPDFREDDLTRAPDARIMDQLPREPYIMFVGAFRRIKGDALLLEAYSRLERPPPLVMIGGRTPEPLPELPAGVTRLLDVPHDTVMAAWDGARFGVAPSIVPEALGNVVHEAMSRGKAVIGTRPGGHEDIVDDGTNGLLVPSGDVEALTQALRRLLDDPASTERMGAAARIKAERFAEPHVMAQLERLLRDAALRGRVSRG